MIFNRRTLLQESALGFGCLALTAMLAEEGLAEEGLAADGLAEEGLAADGLAADGLAADGSGNNESLRDASHLPLPHHLPTAKSIIFLFMSGAPGQTDTFDPKPMLRQLDGQPVPESIAATIPNIPRSGVESKLFASPFSFQQYGHSGIPVSSLYPHTAQMADDLCVVRSMNHRVPVHGPGECIALTGTGVGDRPSLGAWINYGLGSQASDLPGFMVFLSNLTGPPPQLPGWDAGFLPARYQGTLVDGNKGVPYTDMPSGYTEANRRRQLDFINDMNRRHLAFSGPDSELEARIASYELGYRMQASAPEVFDLTSESQHTRDMYALEENETAEFGAHCLLARRLVERGVRCIQLRNGGWDAHSNLESNHLKGGAHTDKPIAGLLKDLKQRGLLDTTLVVWGGEFGRTPTIEGTRTGKNRGRDHSPAGYTMWLAGGGVNGGQIIGATDELGYVPVERPLAPADMHATLLHALGIDQHRLSYNHHNRDEIPTVFGGEVIQEVFA